MVGEPRLPEEHAETLRSLLKPNDSLQKTPETLHRDERESYLCAAREHVRDLAKSPDGEVQSTQPWGERIIRYEASLVVAERDRDLFDADRIDVIQNLDDPNERIVKLEKALAFASSCIKCGEPWTETCDREISDVLRSPK